MLANYLATEDTNDESLNALPTTYRKQQEIYENQDQSEFESENVQDSDEPILAMKERTQTRKNKAKKVVLTTWARGPVPSRFSYQTPRPKNQVDKLTH